MRDLDWRVKALLTGGVIGTALGLTAAYLYIHSVEEEGTTPEIQPSEAVGIGLAILAVLRQIATLHEGDSPKKLK